MFLIPKPFCTSFILTQTLSVFLILKKSTYAFLYLSADIRYILYIPKQQKKISSLSINTIYLMFSVFSSNFSFMFLKFSFIFPYLFFSSTTVMNSSWLISRSINAGDNRNSMLLNLLLASIRILLYFFFLFLVICKIFLVFLLSKKLQK